MSLIFRRLGLGGGAIKGILHVGALLELSKYQPLHFPDGVYGISVGAIIATYVAFGLPFDEKASELLTKHMDKNKFLREIQFEMLSNCFTKKGLYSMDEFEQNIIEMFEARGLDIRDKVLADAKMPLHIVASNLTCGIPTIFSNQVPVLEALKCSCCVPLVFQPRILYDQVYVDGDIFCPSIDSIMKLDDTTICFSLKKNMYDNEFTPKKMSRMTPLKYIYDLHTASVQRYHDKIKTDKTLVLSYPGLRSYSDIHDISIIDVFRQSAYDLTNFLRTKGIHKKLSE